MSPEEYAQNILAVFPVQQRAGAFYERVFDEERLRVLIAGAIRQALAEHGIESPAS